MSNSYITSHRVNYGKRIIPLKQIELFSPDDWEDFIEEWTELKKTQYIEIERFGGAGDKGRDVVAYISKKTLPNYSWDCYQCKHYNSALTPTEVYVEFGKIIYYTFLKEFPVPNNYYFIAPKGCGTSLSKLLNNKILLKKAVKDNWDKYCKDKITSSIDVELKGEFLKYYKKFDFSIFSKIQTKDILREHQKHPNHIIRFGGGLPEREKLDESSIPKKIQKNESAYVSELLKAYSSVGTSKISKVTDLKLNPTYNNHFRRSRLSFHHAEQLRNFSRDSLPIGTFVDFQNEIYAGIIDIVDDYHSNGFVRIKEVEKEARRIVIASNPLKEVSIINDRSGVCHQLANNKKIKWT